MHIILSLYFFFIKQFTFSKLYIYIYNYIFFIVFRALTALCINIRQRSNPSAKQMEKVAEQLAIEATVDATKTNGRTNVLIATNAILVFTALSYSDKIREKLLATASLAIDQIVVLMKLFSSDTELLTASIRILRNWSYERAVRDRLMKNEGFIDCFIKSVRKMGAYSLVLEDALLLMEKVCKDSYDNIKSLNDKGFPVLVTDIQSAFKTDKALQGLCKSLLKMLLSDPPSSNSNNGGTSNNNGNGSGTNNNNSNSKTISRSGKKSAAVATAGSGVAANGNSSSSNNTVTPISNGNGSTISNDIGVYSSSNPSSSMTMSNGNSRDQIIMSSSGSSSNNIMDMTDLKNSHGRAMEFLDSNLKEFIGWSGPKEKLRTWLQGIMINERRKRLTNQHNNSSSSSSTTIGNNITSPTTVGGGGKNIKLLWFIGNNGTGKSSLARLLVSVLPMVGIISQTSQYLEFKGNSDSREQKIQWDGFIQSPHDAILIIGGTFLRLNIDSIVRFVDQASSPNFHFKLVFIFTGTYLCKKF